MFQIFKKLRQLNQTWIHKKLLQSIDRFNDKKKFLNLKTKIFVILVIMTKKLMKRKGIQRSLVVIRSASDWPRACWRSSWTTPSCFFHTSWTSSKSSSIWPESGLKRRSPGSKKHMLIRSIDVRIRTRRDHFWTSSVLVEHQKLQTLDMIYEEME